MVYDASVVPMLVRVVRSLLAGGVAALYIASTVRNTETRDVFIQALGLCSDVLLV